VAYLACSPGLVRAALKNNSPKSFADVMRSLNVALVVINRRVEKTNGGIKCGKQVVFECYSHP
jgi:hypothetical protein